MAFQGLLSDQARVERDAIRAAEGRIRWSYDAQGRILELENGLIVVPYEQTEHGWYVVVIDPGPDARNQQSYPRGGYNLLVFEKDIETAAERAVDAEQRLVKRIESVLAEYANFNSSSTLSRVITRDVRAALNGEVQS